MSLCAADDEKRKAENFHNLANQTWNKNFLFTHASARLFSCLAGAGRIYTFRELGEVLVCLVKTIRRSVELNYGFNTLLSFSSGSRFSLVFPGRDNFSRLKSFLCYRRRHHTTENSISQKQEIAKRLLHIPPQLSEVSTAIKCTIIFGIFIEWKSCKTFLV